MKPLKKGLEATTSTVNIRIQGNDYTVANMTKSGLMNQSTVLIDIDEVWHEVNVIGLGSDEKSKGLQNSNLDNFKNYVELNKSSLRDLGILIADDKPKKDYSLTHDDFMALEKKFPEFDYYKIHKLHEYMNKEGFKSGMYALPQTLKYLQSKNLTVDQYIIDTDKSKFEIINNNSKTTIMENTNGEAPQNERIAHLDSIGFSYYDTGNSYVARWGTADAPASFEISMQSIYNDDEPTWEATLERIAFSMRSKSVEEVIPELGDQVPEENPVTETHNAVPITEDESVKKPVSVATIGNLPANRILEFQKLLIEQQEIVKDNPVVTITDDATLKKAEATAKILLKASTKIDAPKTGVLSTFITHANQFIKMGKDYLEPIAKMTRDQHTKQKTLIDAWKSKEELRKQKEAKDKLEKMQARTKQLFDVPMVFNGSQYVIGTLYILPSMIEASTDDEFAALVTQAQNIKTAQDAAAAAESEKDAEIAALKKKLAELTAVSTPAAENTPEPAQNSAPAQQTAPATNTAPATEASIGQTAPVNKPAATNEAKTAPATAANDGRYPYATVYVEPQPENAILLKLDLENVAHISNPNFIKCRSFYMRGAKDTVAEIRKIFASDHPVKSQAIKEFLEIIEKEY